MSKIKDKAAQANPPKPSAKDVKIQEVKPAVANPDNNQANKGKGVPGR